MDVGARLADAGGRLPVRGDDERSGRRPVHGQDDLVVGGVAPAARRAHDGHVSDRAEHVVGTSVPTRRSSPPRPARGPPRRSAAWPRRDIATSRGAEPITSGASMNHGTHDFSRSRSSSAEQWRRCKNNPDARDAYLLQGIDAANNAARPLPPSSSPPPPPPRSSARLKSATDEDDQSRSKAELRRDPHGYPRRHVPQRR